MRLVHGKIVVNFIQHQYDGLNILDRFFLLKQWTNKIECKNFLTLGW